MKPTFDPNMIVPAFDRFLGERALSFSAIAIGGAALAIMNVIQRATRDLDLLESQIPSDISQAAKDFARAHSLSPDWLNCGPSSLARELPPDWRSSLVPLYSGNHLKLSTLSRLNLIRAKLWAMCDRMRDVDDLVALRPAKSEIQLAVDWVKPLDGNPNWSKHVELTADELRRRLAGG